MQFEVLECDSYEYKSYARILDNWGEFVLKICTLQFSRSEFDKSVFWAVCFHSEILNVAKLVHLLNNGNQAPCVVFNNLIISFSISGSHISISLSSIALLLDFDSVEVISRISSSLPK